MKPRPHKDYQCPACREWIEILESTPLKFICPWCGVHLEQDENHLAFEQDLELLFDANSLPLGREDWKKLL